VKTQVGVGDVRLSELARRYVNEVLATNRLSYGPYSERFEAEFARLHGCAHSVFCNSGTSALQMALAALRERHGWRDGDEVLVPATTFIATSNIVIHNRLRPVFVDVTLADYGMDPEDMGRHITPRTRAVIPVHLCGLPCSIGPIMEVAQRHRLQVIEDSCQTMFVRYHGITVGAFGAVGCFSTHAAHLVVTGVGGLATTNDGDLALTLKSLCSHGRDGSYLKIDDDQGVSRERLTEIVARRFSFVRLGHSLRGTEMEAALGLAQLEEREPMLKARRANAAALRAGLADLTGRLALPPHPAGREHAYMVFPLRVHGGADERRALVNFLEDNGIETRDLFPLLTQPIYRARFGDLTAKYPVASELATSGFYVGCHPGMSQADLDYVTDRLHAFPWPGRRRWNGSAPSPGGGMGPQG
jgi:dTDP-4-amino-4,6-dideoxygalactose transaminase